MTTFDWIVFGVCWSLIPAVLLLRAYLDRQTAKSQAVLDKAIADYAVYVRKVRSEAGGR